ncbi:MAG: glycosyltransferase family 39 protein [Dehalococcoidia bacterium]|nr:glycosyltransferase family 39 protein [Dehalococcoidia bacterium]
MAEAGSLVSHRLHMNDPLEQPKTNEKDRTHGWGLSGWDLTALLVLGVLLLTRVWRLQEIPANVTGDEVTYLNEILRIIHLPDSVNLLTLMGDGSKSGINMYYMALFVRAFPETQAIQGMRLASGVFSIISLGAFYLYLRSKVAPGPALCSLLLLGTNYVYLNLSRSSWFGVGTGLGLTFGLISFLLVERAVSGGKRSLAVVGGALGGLTFYSYLGTVFLPVASLGYFAYAAFRGRLPLRKGLAQAALFTGAALLVCLPNLLTIAQNAGAYTLRSRTVYIGQTDDAFYRSMDAGTLAWMQITNTVRGFLLLDPAVTGDGPENARYSPAGESPVDTLTRALFLLAIPTALFIRRKDLAQPAFAFLIMLAITQALTVYPPNYARGVFALPFIYLLVGVLLDSVWAVRLTPRYTQLVVVVVVVAISVWNIQHYFQWGGSVDLAEAREPAIEYSQVPLWIATEKLHLKAGLLDLVITSDEWQQLVGGSGPLR